MAAALVQPEADRAAGDGSRPEALRRAGGMRTQLAARLRRWSLLARLAAPMGAAIVAALTSAVFYSSVEVQSIVPFFSLLGTAVVPVLLHVRWRWGGQTQKAARVVFCVPISFQICRVAIAVFDTDASLTEQLEFALEAGFGFVFFACVLVGMSVGHQPVPRPERSCVVVAALVLDCSAAIINPVRTGDHRAFTVLLPTSGLGFALPALLAGHGTAQIGCSAAAEFERAAVELEHAEEEASQLLEQPGLFDAAIQSIKFQGYRKVRVLGHGRSATTWLLRNDSTGERVVFKVPILDETVLDPEQAREEVRRVETEVRLLTKLRHRHVIEYLSSFHMPSAPSLCLCIVMEYAAGGDLSMVLVKARMHAQVHDDTPVRPADVLPSVQVRSWLSQIARALQYIHGMNILHRDLKPANVLLTEAGECKIADFGFSFQTRSAHDLSASFVGTPLYMSPEALTKQPRGQMSDVWSLGIIAFELMALRRPFVASGMEPLIQKVLAGNFGIHTSATAQQALTGSGHPQSLMELVTMDALLNQNPDERMTLEVLLECLEASRGDDAPHLADVTPPASGEPSAKRSRLE